MLKFKIHFKVDYGQSISILGNSNVVGNWNDVTKAPLNWSDGDIWWIMLLVDAPFEYKYVVVQSGKAIRWEQGLNRFCFPASLKSKELFDEWEHFQVRFSIYYPG